MRMVSKMSPRGTIYSNNIYDTPTADVWQCLTCELCSSQCPQGVSFSDFVLEERAGKTLADIPHEGVFSSVSDLMSMLDAGKVTFMQGAEKSSYGYFPGCLDFHNLFFGLEDVDFTEIAESSMKLLKHAGIDPMVMQMKCCGHDQLWQGNKELFDRLAEYNTRYIEESGISTLIVSCAECYRTLTKDYDLKVDVKHISELLGDAKFDVKSDAAAATVTYHDACRLGRHCGVYDAPRESLANAGMDIVEMAHSKEDARCCGVSSLMNCNEVTKALRVTRMNEADDTGASAMVTSCPKCLAHFNCLKKDESTDYNFEVVDLSVLLARQLNGSQK